MENDKKQKMDIESGEKITRKEAIKKVGITALTTASLLFLQTKAKAGGSVGAYDRPSSAPSRGR